MTVLAYVFSVSLAAILLSLYYVFLWDPKQSTTVVTHIPSNSKGHTMDCQCKTKDLSSIVTSTPDTIENGNTIVTDYNREESIYSCKCKSSGLPHGAGTETRPETDINSLLSTSTSMDHQLDPSMNLKSTILPLQMDQSWDENFQLQKSSEHSPSRIQHDAIKDGESNVMLNSRTVVTSAKYKNGFSDDEKPWKKVTKASDVQFLQPSSTESVSTTSSTLAKEKFHWKGKIHTFVNSH